MDRKQFTGALLTCTATAFMSSGALASDADALLLESAPAAKADDPSRMRLFVEGGIGQTVQRHGLGRVSMRRVSIDYTQDFSFAEDWRIALSNRLDQLHPEDRSGESTINSFREGYAEWRAKAGDRTVEFGRVNLRLGPAYGYNPTDYFRDGSLRTVTSVDPLAQRRNRLGAVMLRFQQFWSDGSASLAVAPKLGDKSSDAGFSADLGSTNRSNRALATWSARLSDRFSGQALLFAEQDIGAQAGASFTALLSSNAVLHLEGSRGRSRTGQDNAAAVVATGNRLSTGLTYTLPSSTVVTAEYQYNGFAKDSTAWSAATPGELASYLTAVQDRQDIASRRALLLYVTQSDLAVKHLDLTALLRVNAIDHSRLGWLELRYHWPKVDAAIQLTWSRGEPLSEYGLLPLKRAAQFLLSWHI